MTSLPFQKARDLLEEGDVLLFRGQGIFSFFIKRAAEGKYSHVGVVSGHGTNGGRIWECVEFREGKGGRTINLEQYVEQHPGIIDVYRAVSSRKVIDFVDDKAVEREIGFNGKAVTNIMRKMTGLPYGWRRIFWIMQHKIPFLRLFYPIDSVVDDETHDLIYPVCSTAVAYAFSRVGYDLLPNRADKATEPSGVSRSALLQFLFTLE